ncbi:MAG TPA: PDR/VanB family oxidoreductase [Nocardiopsis listeri]|uniref:PDR/VanB family oxidoreductase n=1 Tax=Nocardiopsis listeri TaxID=53440 RepID=UPI001DA97DF5|nr:PDR/VanB family oxidoreductase [Nocardiopsis listeri]HJE59456.1 PDR/VanB family oxidoreductase [Nocardiopsis listeri]
MTTTTGMPPELVVEGVHTVAQGIRAVILAAPDGRALPPWSPGAHLDVELPNRLTRQYSLCGDPADPCRYRIAVKHEELSRGGSEYLHLFLRPGTRLRVAEPRTTFPEVTPPGTLFIAGGIGITAVLAMFLRDLRRGHEPTLLYAGRSRASMPFLDELAENAHVVIAASDEGERLDLPAWARSRPEGTEIVTCGPPRMVAEIEEVFDDERFGGVHVERFRAEPRSFADDRRFVAECARSGKEVTVPAGETLMDALLKQDIPLGTGCREGVCGSCEVKVLAGEPEHRDLLGASEGRMYPCVSRSLTETLVLDV